MSSATHRPRDNHRDDIHEAKHGADRSHSVSFPLNLQGFLLWGCWVITIAGRLLQFPISVQWLMIDRNMEKTMRLDRTGSVSDYPGANLSLVQ